MEYLLDTNTISDFYRGEGKNFHNLSQKIEHLNDDDNIYISILTLYEFEYGYSNTTDQKMKKIIRDKINNIANDFYLLSLSKNASTCFGRLKKALVDARNLNKESSKKHNIDIMLASTAIVESCVLISNDRIYLELAQIDTNLQIDNWLLKE